MTYRREISFPMEPTEKDLKKLRREVARDKFEVVDGMAGKQNPCPGGKIRSGGKGKGLGRGKGKGPVGKPTK